MISIQYLHSSMTGSYYIDCTIVKDLKDGRYVIKYIDPNTEEQEERTVNAERRLKFPKFSDLIM